VTASLPPGAAPGLHGVRLDVQLYRDTVGPTLLLLGGVALVAATLGWGAVLAVAIPIAGVVWLTRPPPSSGVLEVGPSGLRLILPVFGRSRAVTVPWDRLHGVTVEGEPARLAVTTDTGRVVLDWEASAEELHAVVELVDTIGRDPAQLPAVPDALSRLLRGQGALVRPGVPPTR
jgi:hypothetical protein